MLTIEQQATNADTHKHIDRVRQLLNFCIKELLDRGEEHDQSKLESPEVEQLTQYNNELAGSTYGSELYNSNKEKISSALEHHYARNRHHPEHFKNGVQEMNLLDFLEMLCDWKASSERHNDGNIRKSIEHNGDRFKLSPQMIKILENTADYLDW